MTAMIRTCCKHIYGIGCTRKTNTLTFNLLNHRTHLTSLTCSQHLSLSANSGIQEPTKYDLTIVGGGIIGLATARQISLTYPHLRCIVLEKEPTIAAHQSGNNSGVIHAGIYYTPGSLKAKLCVEGLKLMYKYCDENNVPYKKCGKLIVATNESELSRLDVLHDKGIKNEVPDLKVVSQEEIRDIEPNCIGLRALHSPHTGIVDYKIVSESYAKNFVDMGGKIVTSFKVKEFKESENPEYPIRVAGVSSNRFFCSMEVQSKYVITCGGLYSDRLAEYSDCKSEPRIVPFRGEYLKLLPEKSDMVRGNIYPVPDPKFPFLGFHFTPRMNGEIWLGPNAILAFKREGYTLQDVNLLELADSLSFRGLQKLIGNNLSYVLDQLYSGINPGRQVKQLQKFIPQLKVEDVVKGGAGVRAQALDNNGQLVDDFIFDSGPGHIGSRTLHVRNAPSPACTSSLAIAKVVTNEAKRVFKL